MSLFDELKSAAHSLDPQFQLTSNEVPSVLSALVYHLEHPQDFLRAAEDGGVEAVTELLSPTPPEAPEEEKASPSEADLSSFSDAQLEAVLASRHATSQQTTVTHETGAGGDATPPSEETV